MSTVASFQNLAAEPKALSNSNHAGLLLQHKCACGSPTSSLTGKCAECNIKKRLQTKLSIGASNDPLEREADRVAEQVLAAPAHHAVSGAPPRIQRFSGQSNDKADMVPASVAQVLASPGRPLEPALRQDMEQRFSHDFSRVRVHSGAAAEQSAGDVNAHAYTVGHDIIFGAGRFAPGTHQGQRLIAHELTHVVQQSGSGLRLQIQRQLAGCQNLIPAPPQAVGVGIAVHQAIETHFTRSVTGAPKDQVRIPGASAAPGRTQGLCGRDEDFIKPQVLGGKAGEGLPDLARIGTGGVLQVAEIKPATEPCLIDGETQLSRYIAQGNERDAEQVAWRSSLGIKVVSPILASTYPPPTFPFGRCQIRTAWCTAGLLAYAVSCPSRRKQPQTKQAEVTKSASKSDSKKKQQTQQPAQIERGRLRVEGYRPIFEDVANRLPNMEAPVNHYYNVVIDSSVYKQMKQQAEQDQLKRTQRLMSVDPRNIPMFTVTGYLIKNLGPIIVFDIVGLVALLAIPAVVAAPEAGVAAGVSAGAEAGGVGTAVGIGAGVAVPAATIEVPAGIAAAVSSAAAAAPGAAAAVTGAGMTWAGGATVTQAAAAAMAVTLVAGGMSEAEAAAAVKPLIGKRIYALVDTTDMTDAKASKEITLGGQSFTPIIRLTSRKF